MARWYPSVRWLQFRLSTLCILLVVVPVTACISYRLGVRNGIDEQLARQREGTMYVQAYEVKDLVLGPGMTAPDYKSLTDVLKLISPHKWSDNGGAGEMSPFPDNYTLIVNQDAATHRLIAAKLEEFRRLQRPSALDKLKVMMTDPYVPK